MLKINSFRHVALLVENLEKMREFYEEVLGFTCIRNISINNEDFHRGMGVIDSSAVGVILQIPNTYVEIEMLRVFPFRDMSPENSHTNAPGFRHISFTVDDIEASYRELTALGVSFIERPIFLSDPPDAAGLGFAYFKDPEGNLIELNQLPDEED